ncbi:DUF6152 family protein [Candidatus Rariloculus sp.]|uniref:DUF6152 family protein n=1 Tax=Candidatus Rariloculus sp. TaxID=3101265 RepID=UPI003D140681
MSRIARVFFISAVFSFVCPPLLAHHGAGIFDAETTVSLTGTVTDFQYVNPHVLVYITVTGVDGAETAWAGELTSPNRLSRMSGEVRWHKDVLKPGDEVTMTGHPTRNGSPAIDITRLVDANGVALIGGAR